MLLRSDTHCDLKVPAPIGADQDSTPQKCTFSQVNPYTLLKVINLHRLNKVFKFVKWTIATCNHLKKEW
jgi:hypothetical protein